MGFNTGFKGLNFIQELQINWKDTIVLYFKVSTWQTFASTEGRKSIKDPVKIPGNLTVFAEHEKYRYIAPLANKWHY